MNGPDDSLSRWQGFASELSSYRDSKREIWGDVDEMLVAKYLDQATTDAETELVERKLREQPELRELVEMVRGVMQPPWVGTGPATQLRERLKVWIDETGRLLASGLEELMGGSQPALVPTLDSEVDDDCCWEIPVEEFSCKLVLRVHMSAEPGNWMLTCELKTEADAPVGEPARITVSQPGDLPVYQGDANGQAQVQSGEWEIKLEVGREVRVVRVELELPQ